MPKRRRLNRELVIGKAVEMADESRDYKSVSLTALANALQIRPPSLYNHIAGQDDLFTGIAIFAMRQLLAELRQASLGLIGWEAILAIAQAYRAFARAHPGIYPLTIRSPQPEEADLVTLAQEMLQMLLLIMASAGLQGEDALHTIRGLRAILHGFTSLEDIGGYKMPIDREESFNRLISTYLQGLQQ